MPIVILPRTTAGRDLLRFALPFAVGSDRPDGELPDGSSIYNVDYDALAIECARDTEECNAWLRQQEEENGGAA